MNYYHLIALLTINIGFTTIASEKPNELDDVCLSARKMQLMNLNRFIDEKIKTNDDTAISAYRKQLEKETLDSLIQVKKVTDWQSYLTTRSQILSGTVYDKIPVVMNGTLIFDMEAVKLFIKEHNPLSSLLLKNVPHSGIRTLPDREYLKQYQKSMNEETPGEHLKKLEQRQLLSIIVLATMLAIANYNKIIELLKNYIG